MKNTIDFYDTYRIVLEIMESLLNKKDKKYEKNRRQIDKFQFICDFGE